MGPSKPTRDAMAFQVRRTIPLTNAEPGKLEQTVQALRAVEWIGDVGVDGRHLRLRYDASAVNFRDIERLLDEAGLQRAAGLWWRCKSGWYRFLDANARSNALSRSGACCSRPPSPWRGDDTPDSRA